MQWRPGFQLAAKMAAESAETTEKKEPCSPVVSAWTTSIGEYKAFWRPATVVRCFHPLFDVQFHTGEIGKRHMNELRTRSYISPSAKAASLRKRQSTAHSSSADAVSQQVPLVQTAEEQSSRLAATSAGAVFRLTWRPTCCCATHRGQGVSGSD